MTLHDHIEQYVGFRRALGERFLTNERVLRAFARALGPRTDLDEVDPDRVRTFLDGTGPITHSWHARHNALLGFYRYAVSRGHVQSSPLPAVLPKRPPPFVPYIYSPEELRRLLAATDTYQRNRSSMEPITVRTLVLLLYGAGLRVSEAVALNRTDVDLEDALLTIRRTKFFKSRLVPFGPRLCQALHRYATRSGASTDSEAPFFTTRSGRRANPDTIRGCFRRVCDHAGIRRTDGGRHQPRLHDLRHASAVHRLTSWHRQGLDVQQLLPQLSVYLGHVHLAATQVYLHMTPELLDVAGRRFETWAGAGVDHD